MILGATTELSEEKINGKMHKIYRINPHYAAIRKIIRCIDLFCKEKNKRSSSGLPF